ncbi:MAG: hypothetical protein A2X84_10450 [Desulfuromonadaceae bacterium GWC2_58_13]|nr:MAG: hypothetical protein A2X84_10450 [Desulfuromonadaceae bacterium GWC2_58_13]
MSGTSEEKLKGIANLFEKAELKSFILNYLIILVVVEGLIFFVCFIVNLSAAEASFPWRPYIFAAFIAPVAITFMFGVVVLFFNKYLYEYSHTPSKDLVGFGGDLSSPSKLQMALHITRQVPFLLGLLMLVVAAGIIYKIDDILIFIGHAGERAAFYLLVSLGVLLAVAAVFGMVWMYLSYRLRREKLNHQYQYRRDVAERLGLVILDDNSVFDREGKSIGLDNSTKALPEGPKEDDNSITLIPTLPGDED